MAAPQEPQPDSDSGSAVPARDPFSAFKLRDFKLYVTSGLLAVIGTQIQNVALGWELWQRTKDPMSLAWLGLVRVLPMLVLGLLAGQVSDWYDRKKILVVCQIISGSCALALAALTSHTDSALYLIYLTVLVRSTATAFGRPARQAFLPQIVPVSTFANAITWNSSIFQLSFVIGPAVGGQIVRQSVPAAFLTDAICTLGSAVFTSLIKSRYQAPLKEPATTQSLLAGLRFVWRNQVILGAMALDMFAVLLGGVTALMPIYADDILKVGAGGLGWMKATQAMGAVSMALLLSLLPPMKHAGRALLWSVAGFGAATVVFGFSESYWLSLAMLFLTGAFDNVSVVVRHSLVQLSVNDGMRGRVSAVNSMFIGASNELGEFESGAVAKFFGPVFAVVSGGIGTIGVVIAASFVWPKLRQIGALHDIRPDAVEEKPKTPEAPAEAKAS